MMKSFIKELYGLGDTLIPIIVCYAVLIVLNKLFF